MRSHSPAGTVYGRVEQSDDAQRSVSEGEPPGVDAGSDPPLGQGASRTSSRGRRVLVTALIWITTVLAVVGILGVWANRQMLDPDNWADTTTQPLHNPTIE